MGIQVVEDEFKKHGFDTIEERAAFVKAMLGSDDVVSFTRPFIWRSNDEWKGDSTVPKKDVRSLSPLTDGLTY